MSFLSFLLSWAAAGEIACVWGWFVIPTTYAWQFKLSQVVTSAWLGPFTWHFVLKARDHHRGLQKINLADPKL